MLPTIRDLSVTTNKNERRTTPPNQRQSKLPMNQKTDYAEPGFGKTVDATAYSIEDPQTKHNTESKLQCNGIATEDWLRRQAIATIKRYNAKHEQQKEYPTWIEDSNDQQKTTKRPLSQSDQERIYVYDKDYRCEPWDRPDIYDLSTFSFEQQPIATSPDQNTNDNDEQLSSQPPEENNYGTTTRPIFPDEIPASLNSIKEYIGEKDGDTYISLQSTIILKKRRRMFYFPLGIGEITMDGLVDSGVFINAMSWSDYNAIKMSSDNCIIKEYP